MLEYINFWIYINYNILKEQAFMNIIKKDIWIKSQMSFLSLKGGQKNDKKWIKSLESIRFYWYNLLWRVIWKWDVFNGYYNF